MQHCYQPTAILSNVATVSTLKLMKELCRLLEVWFNFATVKRAWTIDVIERSHLSLKKYLKVYDRIKTRIWRNHVDFAALAYTTTHHWLVGCSPSVRLYERQPQNALELRFQNRQLKKVTTTYDFNTQNQFDSNERFAYFKDSTPEAYHHYEHYFDRKTTAHPLEKHSFLFTAESEKVWSQWCNNQLCLKMAPALPSKANFD